MKIVKILIAVIVCVAIGTAAFFGVKAGFPRPYAQTVRESGLEPSLVYAVMKAESGFDEDAVSRSGAVGLMQLRPTTAEFVCNRSGIGYESGKLTDGEYNIRLGCLYLKYLMEKFPARDTALAAYNAGEGTVGDWLSDASCSNDGVNLSRIPYPETRAYLKKIKNFRKMYEFFY